jgi:hypothetical protein
MKRRCMNPLLAQGTEAAFGASEEMVLVFSLVQDSRGRCSKRGKRWAKYGSLWWSGSNSDRHSHRGPRL